MKKKILKSKGPAYYIDCMSHNKGPGNGICLIQLKDEYIPPSTIPPIASEISDQ